MMTEPSSFTMKVVLIADVVLPLYVYERLAVLSMSSISCGSFSYASPLGVEMRLSVSKYLRPREWVTPSDHTRTNQHSMSMDIHVERITRDGACGPVQS